MEFLKKICGQMRHGKNTENKNEHKVGMNRTKIIREVKLHRISHYCEFYLRVLLLKLK